MCVGQPLLETTANSHFLICLYRTVAAYATGFVWPGGFFQTAQPTVQYTVSGLHFTYYFLASYNMKPSTIS